ncbi:molybdopterin-dependent oxidoreductase [Sphingomonas piscis]|uniref:Molybdopterin-dependent oxidoreductase n=1 Tax=Sphingomonas piscis TaxID=2714943 RepID=A0A6G7YQJ8_9SPHN|nr:molybdopterin cofactor-binding domain-containing protein [Sphingomonas piscis]QIK79013.1 molybdopterin-dependent oxidoreductase [Sphingomonas piscis]
MPVGDQGGVALENAAVPIAIALARQLKRPVQVGLSPNVAQNHGRPAPGALARMYGLNGPSGAAAAWKMRVVTADGFGASIARLTGSDVPLEALTASASAFPYSVPNVRIDAVAPDLPFAPGYMRGSPERELTFFTESFADEMARAAGLDPLSYRIAMLGTNPRLANCLQRATSAAGWDGGGVGSIMGLAVASAFGSHIALVAEASIGSDQRIEVHRLVASVDCGRIVNTRIVRQQIEGGLMWALGQATVAAPEWSGGMPLSRTFRALGLPRIDKVPDIRVDLVPSAAAPGGVNGLATVVLAPALANALHAGTGKRMRSLPFDVMAA